jgi:hypothetical protein
MPGAAIWVIASAAHSRLLPPREANPDFPGRHFAIFLFAVEINLSGANIRMSGKFAHFMQSTVTMHPK